MNRIMRCTGLLMLSLGLAMTTGAAGQDQKQDKKQDQKTDTSKKDTARKDNAKTDKVKPDWIYEFNGKLTALEDKGDDPPNFTIQISYKVSELNSDAQRQIGQRQQTLAQQQVQLAQAKNAKNYQNILNQMANTQMQMQQSMAQLYKLKDVNLDVKCKAADGFRVRKYEPVELTDPDTGEFIKMTKEKIADAKGKEGYPGYKADSKVLKTGQYVRAYIWKDTKTPATFLDKSKQDSMKPAELQAAIKKFRYDVIMIYVGTEPPPSADKSN